MTIDGVVLLGAALVFLGVAVQGLFFPRRIIEPLDQQLESVSLKNEVRANYGGMHLGMAVLTALAAFQPTWQRAGLALLFAFSGGLVFGRLVSWVADGTPNRYLRFFGGLEAIGAIAAAVLLFRSGPG